MHLKKTLPPACLLYSALQSLRRNTLLSPARLSYRAQTEGALCQMHAGNSHEGSGQEQPAEKPCSDLCCGACTVQTMGISQHHGPGVTNEQQMLPRQPGSWPCWDHRLRIPPVCWCKSGATWHQTLAWQRMSPTGLNATCSNTSSVLARPSSSYCEFCLFLERTD